MGIKVLHVIARMNMGGTASYLYNLISNSSENIEHLLVTGNVSSREIEDPRLKMLPNIKVPWLRREINFYDDVRARKEIKNIISAFQPNVINTHTFKAGLLTRTLSNSVPLIHTFHGHLLDDPEFVGIKSKVIVQVERILARRTTMLTTTGENVRLDLERAGVRHELWRNIYPGLDPLSSVSPENARLKLGLSSIDPERPLIAWHSRFAPVKNVQLVMEIAEALPDYFFMLSGGGPLYEKYSSAHPKNVMILGWQAPENVFGAADILISTSFNEGLSFSIIEASMLGKPCIATNVGAASEIINDGHTGFLVDNSVNSFVEKLRLLATNKNLRLAMGQKARLLATERFGMSVFVEKYADLLQEAIQKKG
jgi:glycosyltransferase involved in cell wall biosynthesis